MPSNLLPSVAEMSDIQKFLRELGQSLSDFLERELPWITGSAWWECVFQ